MDRHRATPPLRITAGNPGPLTLDGTNSWLIECGREEPILWVLIDPGPLDPRHLAALKRVVAGHPVAAICLTHAHADHSEAAAVAAERFDAPIAASARTLDRLGLSGIPLADGDAVPGGGEPEHARATGLNALETPGHSGDHLCFFRPADRSLFTGDLVLGAGSSMVAHPDGSVGDYLASLSRLIDLVPLRIHPGHGPVVEDAVARLREYHEHRLERQRQVEAAVAAGARDVAAIREVVYGDLPAGVAGAADLSIRAHLAYMEKGS